MDDGMDVVISDRRKRVNTIEIDRGQRAEFIMLCVVNRYSVYSGTGFFSY